MFALDPLLEKREAWHDLLSLRARLDELLAVALPSG
jgi:hypothetical protein